MPRYLSLSWKMLILMLSLLLAMLVWFTSLTLLHMNDQFNRQQQLKRLQGQQYFQYYNHAIEQRILVWMQSFAELQQLEQATDFEQFVKQLTQHSESLQLHFAVKQLTLVGPQQQLLYQFGDAALAPPDRLLQQTLQQQRPQATIFCQTQCYKQLSLPLLNKYGDVAVLMMTTDLTDLLFTLHQTLGLGVAIINYQPLQEPEQQLSLLQASDRELLLKLYQQTKASLNIELIKQQGVTVELEGMYYYLQFIGLDAGGTSQHLLLMVEDVSAVMLENQRYQRRILWVAAGCFVLLLLLVLITSRRLSRRILKLAAALPLLAQRRYAEFRQRSELSAGLLQDELSTFQQSVISLSHELEHLDLQLAQQTDALQQMAMFDGLTGLANRNSLQQQLNAALSALTDNPAYVGVLFLDLDNFKNINNSRSHAVGDNLLVETAERLSMLISGSADRVYRFGGDEFAMVLPQMVSPLYAEQLAADILAVFEQPFVLQSGSVSLSASIGISWSDDSSLAGEELIRRADLAMYQAKHHGRNCFYQFNEKMSFDLASRLQLEAELRQAIALQQFSLSLQPQINLSTGKLSGFEALLRWHHPERGVVPPDEFISVLEQAQLMVDVGYWVFERSCQLCVELIQQGLTDIVIAVNLSADQFLEPELPQRFARLLAQYQLGGQHFELELTESTLVSHVSQTLDVMHQLKALGCRFAIDDFGTGYSSLNYLKRMPVDTIKIDKSFILGMLENPADYQIIVSTIAMVQKLGLQVVAEGVETLQHLKILQQYHCDFVQGFYFSMPIPETELRDFVRQQLLKEQWPAQLLR